MEPAAKQVTNHLTWLSRTDVNVIVAIKVCPYQLNYLTGCLQTEFRLSPPD